MASTKKVILLLLVTTTSCHGITSITRKVGAPFSSGSSTMGVVYPTTRCGGVGTPLETRISDCNGRCALQPGRVYDCEKDFMPSSPIESLSLIVEICQNGPFCSVILMVELPNSSVQPGFVYTAKYSIVPNDILSGMAVEFRASLFQSRGGITEVCVSAVVDIL